MKTRKSIVLFTMLLWTAMSLAQSFVADKVPEEVQSAFKAKFPDGGDVSWSSETNTNYEAKFTVATMSLRAEFDKNGVWLETETVIKKTDLPAKVSSTVMSKNPSCKIADAEEIQSADLGKMYKVGCATKSGNHNYRVTTDGKIEATLSQKY